MRQIDPWPTNPMSLMSAFRDALLALLPMAERVHMPWKEPDNYDDWDAIASAIFGSFVIRSIENASNGSAFLPVAPYDRRLTSYKDNSYIAALGETHPLAFVCLQTKISPFDTCLFAILGEHETVSGHCLLKFDALEFVFVRKNNGCSDIIQELEVAL